MQRIIEITNVIKALADESRVRILRILLRGSFQVGELVAVLDMGQSRVSRHLKILTDAGVLTAQREGTRMFYRVARDEAFGPKLASFLAGPLGAAPVHEDDTRLHAVWEERRDRSRDAFRRAAIDWSDAQAAFLGSPDTRPHLVGWLDGLDGVAVDVGTGTGELLRDLAVRFRRVIGIDGSAPMLERAREGVRAMGATNVELRLGDVEHLPLPEGEADVVVANMVMHHVSEPALALRELLRGLLPGGRLLIGDYTRHDNEWMREELGDQWLGFDPDEVAGWLRSAGFERIEVKRVTAESSPMGIFVARAHKPGTGQE